MVSNYIISSENISYPQSKYLSFTLKESIYTSGTDLKLFRYRGIILIIPEELLLSAPALQMLIVKNNHYHVKITRTHYRTLIQYSNFLNS